MAANFQVAMLARFGNFRLAGATPKILGVPIVLFADILALNSAQKSA